MICNSRPEYLKDASEIELSLPYDKNENISPDDLKKEIRQAVDNHPSLDFVNQRSPQALYILGVRQGGHQKSILYYVGQTREKHPLNRVAKSDHINRIVEICRLYQHKKNRHPRKLVIFVVDLCHLSIAPKSSYTELTTIEGVFIDQLKKINPDCLNKLSPNSHNPKAKLEIIGFESGEFKANNQRYGSRVQKEQGQNLQRAMGWL